MFKRWIPASLIGVAIALALAGSAVLAFGGGNNERRAEVFERAAEILGIEPAQLEDAHNQARRELEDEKLEAIVQKLVDSETITQENADSLTAWVQARPDVADESLIARLTTNSRIHTAKRFADLELRGFGLNTDGDLTERMAAILGIEPNELGEALSEGASSDRADDRSTMMHAVVDDLRDSDVITADEAEELHDWVDQAPQWLLDIELNSLLQPGFPFLGFSNRHLGELDGWRLFLPFGDKGLGGELGDFEFDGASPGNEFRFEYRGPEGSFRYGPGHESLPFDSEQFQDLFERFNIDPSLGLEGLDGPHSLEGMLEGLRGRGFFSPPFVVPETLDQEPETTPSDA